MRDIICETYFSCPIYVLRDDYWVKKLNKISDKHLKLTRSKTKLSIDKRNQRVGDVGDHGFSYHSDQMMKDPKMSSFNKHILDMSRNILLSQGYNLNAYKLQTNELWVQEFAKKGGGHHSAHIHWNQHVSGFIF